MFFNSRFATQCSLISNSSKLPSHIKYLTDNCLSFVSFSHDKIAKVIQNLVPNKAHGQDNISIRMVKVCGLSIYKPRNSFQSMPWNWCFSIWLEKGNIVHIHKKGDKQKLQNYRPVSLVPICRKILERLMFNETFEFFIENKLISSSQSVLNRAVPVSINCYLLLMQYIVLLMKALKLEVYSSISQTQTQNGISGN